MYLEDGREIYESDDYPGYYIDSDTGLWCNEEGKFIGGSADDGDKPGGGTPCALLYREYVYVTKSGKQYYHKRTKSANIRMSLEEARKKGYKPSKGYNTFKVQKARKKLKSRR